MSDIILNVRVKPNSSKFSVDVSNEIVISCKSPPKNNKANIEIVKQLKRLLKRGVTIESGLKSKKKRIKIHNITMQELMGLLK